MLLYALQCPTRQKILEILSKEGKKDVKQLAERLGVSSPNISNHLRILESANMIKLEEEYQPKPTGRRGRIYSINEAGCNKELPLGNLKISIKLEQNGGNHD